MYHALEDNRLYDFTNGLQVDVSLSRNGKSIDVIKFLEDTTLWMEDHQKIIKEKYLPFSCVAVGLPPREASAFLFGVFVGRAMQKDGLVVSCNENKIDKKVIASKVKESINKQIKWFRNLRKQIDKAEGEEKEPDGKT